MKYYLICCVFMMFLSNETFAQSDSSLNYQYQGRLLKQRSKTENTIGIILVSGGLTLSYIGLKKMLSTVFIKSSVGETGFGIGVVMALSSVPLFVSASKNKRKSTFLLKQEKVPTPLPNQGITSTSLVWRIRI